MSDAENKERAEKLYDEFVETNKGSFAEANLNACEETADELFDDFVNQFPDEGQEVYDLAYEHIYAGLT